MIERLRRYVRARRRTGRPGSPSAAAAPGPRDVEETHRRLEDARQRLKQTVPPPEDGTGGPADETGAPPAPA